MSDYANTIDRERFIAGLRALAEYLESKPDVPTPRHGATILVFPLQGTNEGRRAEIDAIATRVNAEPCEIVNGHYTVSRFFGPVEYRAVAIDLTPDGSDGEVR
jgi:hypothetical protein